jgi:tetratricopeptide (TPR) repeat protein
LLSEKTRFQEPNPTEVDMMFLPTITREAREQPHLLMLLDSSIQKDTGDAEFEGNLVIAVRRDEGGETRFWHARFKRGKRPETAYVDSLPSDVDAALYLSEREADSMLEFGTVGDDANPLLSGDRGLIQKFVARYLKGEARRKAQSPEAEAAKLYAMSIVLVSKGQRSFALENLCRAIQIQSDLVITGRKDLLADLASSLNYRARLLSSEKQYDEALRDFEEAIRIRTQLVEQGQRPDLLTALADSRSGRALAFVIKSSFHEALRDFDVAIELRMLQESLDLAATKALADDHGHRALARSVTNDAAGAVEDYGRAIQLYKGLVEAGGETAYGKGLAANLSSRAEQFRKNGRLTEALSDYDLAIELRRRSLQRKERTADTDLAADLCERARTYQRMSRTNLAVCDLQEVIRLYSDLVDRLGMPDFAEKLADACFECAVDATTMVPSPLERKPLWDEAIRRYSRLVLEQGREDLRPRLAESHLFAGIIEGLPFQDVLDRLTEAIAIYEDLRQRRQDTAFAAEIAWCLCYRAQSRSRYGQFAEAINDYERAIALDTPLLAEMPQKVSSALLESLNGLAWIRATCPNDALREGRRAVEYATRACELTAWSDRGTFDTLAAAYAEAGNFESAVKWQLKAREQASQEETVDFQARLELYRARTPYREPPATVESSA